MPLVAVFDLQSKRWVAWSLSEPLYTGAYDDRGMRPRLEYFEIDEMTTSLGIEMRAEVAKKMSLI